ncbi:flagellar biosynthesis repressor FlbT [Tranquillimonas alkanivorans]|uniref:Flagellar protein FlbT n=1 Tax=Tranquillimonas alkanivorans TaxID=441119 RepID=A0A1I5S4B4_9RHOB|nr:flagellar biosynthesis repressor FlbT [Tranquillimonas alkanivorans]SFP65582.1 flagellar protein FlbT [Tranquillimonas alkanivorans]
MALKLTLKPNERIIVNGCAIRNADRRQVLTIESRADVVRGHDLLEPDGEATPVRKAYFLIQTALIRADVREKIVPIIQTQLADLATCFGPETMGHVFEAANFVSMGDYYKAMRSLRPVMKREEEVFAHVAAAQPRDEVAPDELDGAEP